MNYYLYISGSKLKMLYPQIPKYLKGVQAEIKAKLAILEASLKTANQDDTIVSMLSEVVEHIESNYDIGTIEYPGEWVKQKVKVRHVQPHENLNLFALVGLIKDKHYFLLGGTAKHVVGASESSQFSTPISYFPYLVKALVDDFQKIESDANNRTLWAPSKVPHEKPNLASGVRRNELATIVKELYSSSNYPEFEVEFLGRHLATEYHQPWSKESCEEMGSAKSSFITPLYVKSI